MNGIGQTLLDCIRAFPESFSEYQSNKAAAKERLRPYMIELKTKLQDRTRLRAFLNKSLFNGGEVNYLTVKDKGVFHVFWGPDVISILCDSLEVCNSRNTSSVSVAEQKVLFRFKGINLGEIEMRNDSAGHYREIRFNMSKPRIMGLLFGGIKQTDKYGRNVLIYGNAAKHFGRWKKR
jgi:hypothetical protein